MGSNERNNYTRAAELGLKGLGFSHAASIPKTMSFRAKKIIRDSG